MRELKLPGRSGLCKETLSQRVCELVDKGVEVISSALFERAVHYSGAIYKYCNIANPHMRNKQNVLCTLLGTVSLYLCRNFPKYEKLK